VRGAMPNGSVGFAPSRMASSSAALTEGPTGRSVRLDDGVAAIDAAHWTGWRSLYFAFSYFAKAFSRTTCKRAELSN
jgi:hypothetical protein